METNRIDKLKEFLAVSPGDSFLRHALALEYIKTGDDQAAKNIFIKLLADNPGYTGSYYHLAKLLERNGEEKEAMKIYKQGMELAEKAGELQIYNELKNAFEELSF